MNEKKNVMYVDKDHVVDERGFYYFRVYNIAIEDQKLDAKALCVYVALSKCADIKTGECFPSLTTLSKLSRHSKSSVKRALETLQSRGYIEITKRQTRDGEFQTNYYHLKDLEYIKQFQAQIDEVGSQ